MLGVTYCMFRWKWLQKCYGDGDGNSNDLPCRCALTMVWGGDKIRYVVQLKLNKMGDCPRLTTSCDSTRCNTHLESLSLPSCNTFDNDDDDDDDDNDGSLRFKITKSDGGKLIQDCEWVTTNAGNRCTFSGVSSTCPTSYDTCDLYEDSTLNYLKLIPSHTVLMQEVMFIED
mmetsp:Transcript_14151/g.16451  ORF Transcript_14151/g.16451 Transcript_14151/m.16451 type:complete len:172 (-) Transcript_14151:330-845(-)